MQNILEKLQFHTNQTLRMNHKINQKEYSCLRQFVREQEINETIKTFCNFHR